MANILIVDDDELTCTTLTRTVERLGHRATSAGTVKDARKESAGVDLDVVLLDVNLPDGSGLDLLPELRGGPSSPQVIIMTGRGEPDGAELAIRNGAWDYVQKPVKRDDLSLMLTRALQFRDAEMAASARPAMDLEGIVGSSPQMRSCTDMLVKAARGEANVLITGETGTGKELFAWAIHNNSRRAHATLAVVDCAALPESLVESVLFGHEKGAFTGADRAKVGLVSQANAGTLFLDEVGELPLTVQSAFLRVLQERRFRPVGGDREIESDFRVVAATNRDLDQMAENGQFRTDLLFRLKAITIDLPPLRERGDDIRALTFSLTPKICEQHGFPPKGFAPEFLDVLARYEWPGNVRELRNSLETAVASAQDAPTLFPTHLPAHILVQLKREALNSEKGRGAGSEAELDTTPALDTALAAEPTFDEELPTMKDFRNKGVAEIEKRYLQELMKRYGDSVEEACERSGLGRARLYGLLKKHGTSRGR